MGIGSSQSLDDGRCDLSAKAVEPIGSSEIADSPEQANVENVVIYIILESIIRRKILGFYLRQGT